MVLIDCFVLYFFNDYFFEVVEASRPPQLGLAIYIGLHFRELLVPLVAQLGVVHYLLVLNPIGFRGLAFSSRSWSRASLMASICRATSLLVCSCWSLMSFMGERNATYTNPNGSYGGTSTTTTNPITGKRTKLLIPT